MPILPLIILGGGLLLSQLLRPRRPQQPKQQQVIPLPQPPLTEQDIFNSLFLTRDLWKQLSQTDFRAPGADQAKGLLREVQRLSEETAAVRGFSGGMAQRVLADALLGAAPQAAALQQQAQNLLTQQFQLPLQELTTMASLTGQIGGRPVLPMLQFLAQLQASQAAATGIWNPVFNFGMIPPSQIVQHGQWRDIGELAFQILALLLGLGRRP